MTFSLNWLWSNMHSAHQLLVLNIVSSLFKTSKTLHEFKSWHQNSIRDSKEIERTQNIVIQCVTYNFYLDPTIIKRTKAKSTHHTWHLSIGSCKSHKGFKDIVRIRSRNKLRTMTLILKWPWTNIRYAHRLIGLYICASFQNVTNLPWVNKWTRNIVKQW